MKIENVKIVNYNNIIECADIEIKDGKILSINEKDGKATHVVVPGFIDEHIHGFGGMDVIEKGALSQISRALAKHGVVGFLPTTITSSPENTINFLKEMNAEESNGAEIIGYHLEGPFVSIPRKGAHDEKYIIHATKDIVNKFISAANGKVKKMTIAPESFDKNLITLLLDNKIIPSIGHTDVSAEIAKEYIKGGVKSATHLWNAMSGVSNRSAGTVEEVLNNDQVYAELICDLVHVDASAIKLSAKAKGVDKIVAVTDSIKPAGLPDGDSISGGLEITKKGSLITLKGSNTIAGSGATMHTNFKNLINLGFDIKDVVRMTSYNQSINLNLKGLGIIAKGANASMVIMNNDYSIKTTLINGKEY